MFILTGLLFHRAILMSGSALSPWALVKDPARFARQVARHANCSPEMPHPHLLKCLRERPLDAILSTPVDAPDFSSAFGPSIDGVVIDNGTPEQRPQMNQGVNCVRISKMGIWYFTQYSIGFIVFV